jgi:HEAT repeat protein
MKDLDDQIAKAVVDLAAPEVAARRAAARLLFAQGRNEFSVARRDALAQPQVIAALKAALEDEDATVAEEAVGALGMIFRRYRQDESAFDALAKLTKSRRKLTRLWAAIAIGRLLDHPRRWDVLAPLLDDSAPEVQQEICRIIVMSGTLGKLSTDVKKQLRGPVASLVKKANPAVGTVAENALRAIDST